MERAALSATARSSVTTSRASPSPPSAASRAAVVSSASPASSTRRPAVSSRFPRERHPRCRDLHRARPPQDRHRHGRRLRAQAPGPHPLRLRRLNALERLKRRSTTSNEKIAPSRQTTMVINNHHHHARRTSIPSTNIVHRAPYPSSLALSHSVPARANREPRTTSRGVAPTLTSNAFGFEDASRQPTTRLDTATSRSSSMLSHDGDDAG